MPLPYTIYLLFGTTLSILLYHWNITTLIETLLLFAGAVILPMILSLAEVKERSSRTSRLFYLTQKWHPIFLIFLILSFFIDGEWEAVVAGGWMLYTILIGVNGLVRILKRGLLPLEELAIDISLLYLPLGGMWYFLYMTDLEITVFSSTIVLLTAIHFHYSSLVVPVFLGLMGRLLPDHRLLKVMLVSSMISPILIAIGISFSPIIEFISVSLFSLTLILYAILLWAKIVPATKNVTVQILLSISGLSILISMTSAFLYGYGELMDSTTLDIYQMVIFHGITNSIGFSFAGAIGWLLIKPEPLYRTGIPFSKLMGTGRIGADFFERNHLKTGEDKNGLVDNMDEFESENFQPAELPGEIRSFYEDTGDYDLLVHPRWKWGFRTALKIFKRFSVKMEQMNFPLQNETEEEKMESMILSVDDRYDGRKNVRAWIRIYTGTGLPIYVAAYSTHSYRN